MRIACGEVIHVTAESAEEAVEMVVQYLHQCDYHLDDDELNQLALFIRRIFDHRCVSSLACDSVHFVVEPLS